METITITKDEYKELKKKAELNDSLLVKFVRGLEDIRHGRVMAWKSVRKD